jgi:hypothetical protein
MTSIVIGCAGGIIMTLIVVFIIWGCIYYMGESCLGFLDALVIN